MARNDVGMKIEAAFSEDSLPRTGEVFWAGLRDEGIAKVRWWSAEDIADVEDGNPENWQAGFYLLVDSTSECSPVWWLPIDALPDPHGHGVRLIAQEASDV